ncbi:MAG: UDP-N-acetylglucosamine 2-epimerase (non-hydrolyzing) [Candidatus Thiodiazotropha sp. (ex Lucinoma borealis)]|nr:UDP-N-acetylglucosamine 2-epimerase (non-hydrolyzing) [Candidatus Thiodiazotropha sp. (ex Lucinoma borealis)]MCU7867949.1 UDP-N-acetylglucosamine 2-epimerase (non-hydrolyzing) [Candidatus Thiodiazotropha sp. (ex Lucinoma borealis)]
MRSKKLIYIVGGARPNFMKIAPIVRALNNCNKLEYRIVHTGQHYDHDMNDVFFKELGIPEPDYFMSAGGGSHSEQTGKIMLLFEKYCLNEMPDAVLVVGDVNSTLACSIVTKKLNLKLIHVEAGLRSNDKTMPEEINRIVTDSISDIYFVTESSGVDNLLLEGKPENSIYFVGHVMIDNLLYQLNQMQHNAEIIKSIAQFKEVLNIDLNNYGVVTLHRPSNVDNKKVLSDIIEALNEISLKIPLVFSVHPRTKAQIEKFKIKTSNRILSIKPQPYMNFLSLWKDSAIVLTDSGGLQEETTALGVPCITIRENTERPITISEGTNVLSGTSKNSIIEKALNIINGMSMKNRIPEKWDGKAAIRIVKVLEKSIS